MAKANISPSTAATSTATDQPYKPQRLPFTHPESGKPTVAIGEPIGYDTTGLVVHLWNHVRHEMGRRYTIPFALLPDTTRAMVPGCPDGAPEWTGVKPSSPFGYSSATAAKAATKPVPAAKAAKPVSVPKADPKAEAEAKAAKADAKAASEFTAAADSGNIGTYYGAPFTLSNGVVVPSKARGIRGKLNRDGNMVSVRFPEFKATSNVSVHDFQSDD